MVKGRVQRAIWLMGLMSIFLLQGGISKEAHAFAPLPVLQKNSPKAVRQVEYGGGIVVISVPEDWTQIEQQAISPDGYHLEISREDQQAGMWLDIFPSDSQTKIDLDEILDQLNGDSDSLSQRCTYLGRQEGEATGYRAVADLWNGCSKGSQWIRMVGKPQKVTSLSYIVIVQAYFVEESEAEAWQTVNQSLGTLKVDAEQLMAEMTSSAAPLSPLPTPTPSNPHTQPTPSAEQRSTRPISPHISTPVPAATEWLVFLPLVMKSRSTPATPVPTAVPLPTTEVVVLINALNVRSGPGVNYPVIASANQNDRFPVTGMVNNCAWLQVLLPTQKSAWVSGGSQYTTLQGACGNVPIATAPPAPKARANAGQGCYFFRNYISDELTVTFTNKEGNWNTTFKVPKRGTYRACFNPGRYTYTIDVPPPWGSINGMVEVTSGLYQEWPVWGEN